MMYRREVLLTLLMVFIELRHIVQLTNSSVLIVSVMVVLSCWNSEIMEIDWSFLKF